MPLSASRVDREYRKGLLTLEGYRFSLAIARESERVAGQGSQIGRARWVATPSHRADRLTWSDVEPRSVEALGTTLLPTARIGARRAPPLDPENGEAGHCGPPSDRSLVDRAPRGAQSDESYRSLGA